MRAYRKRRRARERGMGGGGNRLTTVKKEEWRNIFSSTKGRIGEERRKTASKEVQENRYLGW